MAPKSDSSGSAFPGFHRILSLTALFEREFSIDWIVELSGEKPSLILSILEEATRHRWMKRNGQGIFFWGNSEKRQEYLDKLTPGEREHCHKKIGNILLRDLPEEVDKKAKILAYHFCHIPENDDNGCLWLSRAGDLHARAFCNRKALECYAKAIENMSAFTHDKCDLLFCKVVINYSKLSTGIHDTKGVLSVIQKAILKSEKRYDQPSLALLKMHLAKNEWLRSRYSKVVKYFENGFSIANELNDPKVGLAAATFKNLYYFWQGYFREAVHHYEKSIPDIEKYPQGRFSLYMAISVAYCYVHIGHTSQGLGMMDAMRKLSLERGDRYSAAHAAFTMGASMLHVGRINDALQYLKCAVEEANQECNGWAMIMGTLMLAFCHYLNGDQEQSLASMHAFLELRRKTDVIVCPFPYLIELCWAMEQGKFPRISDLSLLKEVHRNIKDGNIFMKGVAYRYMALIQKQAGFSHHRILESLNSSLKFLEQSGSEIEIAKSQLEFARQYFLLGDFGKAKEIALMAYRILSSYDGEFFPPDLKTLIQDSSADEKLLKEVLRLGQEVVSIRNHQELVQRIISTGNRITGAERGAIFFLDEATNPPTLRLRASKNLSPDEVGHPNFAASMKMIEDVIHSKKGCISGSNLVENLNSLSIENIRSRICVPMILREKVVGGIYHDNRILSSAFKESDLELLAFFAGQAAIALDNAKAYEEIQHLNQKLQEEKLYYQKQDSQSLHFEDIVGESPAIMHVLAQVEEVARTNTTILILGETGVGKELVAKAIHLHSARSKKPFIKVLCSALPESLLPSELFGHEKGAFTGAICRRIGRFELADGGILFLDEIGDLPLEVQVRLLQVLQSKEFERVGGIATIHSDFRLLAATNRDLVQAIKAGRFRPDLYYRLNVFPIYVPPLRERREDIPLLAHYFLKNHATKMGKSFKGIPESQMDKLIKYEWPGNVRELENVIERATILNSGPLLHVPELGGGYGLDCASFKNYHSLQDNERHHILWALQKTGWKVRGLGGAAELLEIHPSTLAFRMKKLGVQRPPGYPRRRIQPGKKFAGEISSLPSKN